jgi:hypothetical protein
MASLHSAPDLGKELIVRHPRQSIRDACLTEVLNPMIGCRASAQHRLIERPRLLQRCDRGEQFGSQPQHPSIEGVVRSAYLPPLVLPLQDGKSGHLKIEELRDRFHGRLRSDDSPAVNSTVDAWAVLCHSAVHSLRYAWVSAFSISNFGIRLMRKARR